MFACHYTHSTEEPEKSYVHNLIMGSDIIANRQNGKLNLLKSYLNMTRLWWILYHFLSSESPMLSNISSI